MERGGRQAREGRPVYAAQFPKYAKPVGSSRRVSRFPRFSPGHAILNENSILFLLVRKETRESVTWYLRSSTRAHLFLGPRFHLFLCNGDGSKMECWIELRPPPRLHPPFKWRGTAVSADLLFEAHAVSRP